MAYVFYMGGEQLPVTPPSLTMKIGGQNKKYNLINEGEINVLKSPKLTEISFDCLLPNQKYSFQKGSKKAEYYLTLFQGLKEGMEPFQFIVNRKFPNGSSLNSTNLTVSLEDYSIKEDADNGTDVTVSIKLKAYKPFATKVLTIITEESTAATASIEQPREAANAPTNGLPTTYTVVSGDCLWNIAKKFYGSGSKYTLIASANGVSNPNKIYPGDTFTIPAES